MGAAFFVFRSLTLANEISRKPFTFLRQLKVTAKERDQYKIDLWKVRRAPLESDINWSDLKKQRGFKSVFKKVLLLLLLFVLSVIIITPITVRLTYISSISNSS